MKNLQTKEINMISVLNLFRIRSWWNYIVPPVLGAVYFVVMMKEIDFLESVPWILFWFVSIIGTAIFGFLLNDVFDVKTDAKAGKPNYIAALSLGMQTILLFLSLCLAILPWFFLKLNLLSVLLLIIQLLLLFLYSVPPFRFKQNRHLSVICDSLYSGLIFIIATIAAGNIKTGEHKYLTILLVVAVCILLLRGFRNILIHQIADAEHDHKAGIITFVLSYGKDLTTKIITGIVAVEIVGIIVFSVLLSFIVSIWLILIIPVFGMYFLMKWYDKKNVGKGRLFYMQILNDFYEDVLPLAFLIVLCFHNLLFILILAIHVLMFQNKLIWLILYRFFFVIIYRKILLWLYYKLFKNRYVKRFFKTNHYSSSNNNYDVFKEYNTTRNIGYKKQICNAPFVNMYFDVKGNVVPCWLGFTNPDKYPEKTISEIWFGERFNKFRNNIKKLDLEELCGTCLSNLKSGNYLSALARAYDGLGKPRKYPLMMELEMDNRCNLECIMCSGQLSSSIRKNREQKPPLPVLYNEDFIEQIKEFLPHLKELRLNGGEPFLSSICKKLLEQVFVYNPNLDIVMATNGTIWNNNIEQLLEKGRFHINISIDSLVKDVYENIRINSNFEMVMQNFEHFLQYCRRKGTRLCVMVNPMRQNWREMPDFIRFCNKHNVPVWFNTVQHPIDCSLWALPAEELQKIYNTLSKDVHTPITTIPASFHNSKVFHNLVFKQIFHWLNEAKILKKETLLKEQNARAFFYQSLEGYLKKLFSEKEQEEKMKSIEVKINDLLTELTTHNISSDVFFRIANNAPIEMVFNELNTKNPHYLFTLIKNQLE